MSNRLKLYLGFAFAVLCPLRADAQMLGASQGEQKQVVADTKQERVKAEEYVPATTSGLTNTKSVINASSSNPVKIYNKNKKDDNQLILMYMKDFNVYKSSSGQTRCSMVFALVTTLPTKLSNISYRLNWPNISTVLSFSNVDPQVENHYAYSLIGDGCYSMDRSPNIVINRCRVKGMSQQVCAAKVRWITRVQ